jgi:S-adenosylmethionine/arginine decarboxylase-like enzyme
MSEQSTVDEVSYKRTVINGKSYYGKHLMITAKGCNSNLLDVEKVKDFLKGLVDDIDMVAFGEPIVERFGEGIEIGISGVQLITTSAITIHTNDTARDMYLDVFSCKWFDENTVKDVIKKRFSPVEINEQIVLRS